MTALQNVMIGRMYGDEPIWNMRKAEEGMPWLSGVCWPESSRQGTGLELWDDRSKAIGGCQGTGYETQDAPARRNDERVEPAEMEESLKLVRTLNSPG